MAFLKSIISAVLYQPLLNALIFLVWLVPGHNVGWAIIILTIIIRIILLPSSMNATRQQKKMRDLQPEISELQSKYKDDKQKQSQELMKFYKEKKINPLGSCLPLLVQMPILIILYYVFQNGLDTSRFSLLYSFMPQPEYIKTVFFGLDLAKPDKWVLPIIAGALQFVQGWQITPHTPKGEKKEKGPEMAQMMTKQMLYLMPLFTIFIAGKLQAALPLYWIVTSVFTIVQQWYVLRDKNDKLQISNVKSKQERKEEKRDKKARKHGVEVTVRKKGDK
jgi:YidC/Oxa1 family membrane protein insertase